MSESYSRMGRFGHHQQGEVVDEAIATFFKFWKDGRPALLNLNTHGGKAWINFSGFIGFHSEPNVKSSSFHHNLPRQKCSPSPSKIKRNKKRAEAFREKKRSEVGANNFSEKPSKSVSSSNTLADVSDISQNEFDNVQLSDQVLDNQNQSESLSITSVKHISSSNTLADVSDILISSQNEFDNNQISDSVLDNQNQKESLSITPVKYVEQNQVEETMSSEKETPTKIPAEYIYADCIGSAYVFGTTNWDEEFRSKLVEWRRMKDNYHASSEGYLDYKDFEERGGDLNTESWRGELYCDTVLNPMNEWLSDLEERMEEVDVSYSSWIDQYMVMLAKEFQISINILRYPG